MARKAINKNAFQGGLVNAVDSKDLDENSLANATNVMCDISGRVRLMGRDETHTLLEESIVGQVTPGYGLYAFNTDHSLGNEKRDTKMLSIQDSNNIGFFDGEELLTNTIQLSSRVEGTKPSFYYVDGGLRVIDSNFDFDGTTEDIYEPIDSCPKLYKFFKHTLFQTAGDAELKVGGDSGEWLVGPNQNGYDSLIYPPIDILASSNGNLDISVTTGGNVPSAVNSPEEGHIAFSFGVLDNNEGEWDKDSEQWFGYSLTYKGITDNQNQESPVTKLPTALNTSGATNNNHHIQLQMAANVGGNTIVDSNVLKFDPRIKGINLYWYGNATDGDFNSPVHILTWDWEGMTQIETHSGEIHRYPTNYTNTTNGSATWIKTPTITISTLPSLTYDQRNPGQYHSSKTTSSKYKTSCIINRRAYIGGINRLKFSTNILGTNNNQAYLYQPQYNTVGINLDRMLKSPNDKFDIFPEENSIDVALDDGDRIIALEALSDRIFQFKKECLYIINVSGELEYLEEEHKYLGVSNEHQVIKTEYGIVWVNSNGCYIWTEEDGIANLIDNKIRPSKPRDDEDFLDPLQPEGWENFVRDSAMVGYIPNQKQLVVFEDPAITNAQGNIMVYDFNTESWTRGASRTNPLPKSNVVVNYDNSCLYATQGLDLTEGVQTRIVQEGQPGQDAIWQIYNCSQVASSGTGGSQLMCNIVAVTGIFYYDNTVNGSFTTFLANNLNPTYSEYIIPQVIDNDSINFIVKAGNLSETSISNMFNSDGSNKPFAWNTAGSLARPIGVATSTTYTDPDTRTTPAIATVANGPYPSAAGNLMIRHAGQAIRDTIMQDPIFLENGDLLTDWNLEHPYPGTLKSGFLVNWIPYQNASPGAELWNGVMDSPGDGAWHPGLYSYILSVANVRGTQNKNWRDNIAAWLPRVTFTGITRTGTNAHATWYHVGGTPFPGVGNSCSFTLWDQEIFSNWNAPSQPVSNPAGELGPFSYLRLQDINTYPVTESWVSMLGVYEKYFQGEVHTGGVKTNDAPIEAGQWPLDSDDVGSFPFIHREPENQNDTFFGDPTTWDDMLTCTGMLFNRLFVFRTQPDKGIIDTESIKIVIIDGNAYTNPSRPGPTFNVGETWYLKSDTTFPGGWDRILETYGIVLSNVSAHRWEGSSIPLNASPCGFTMITANYQDQSDDVKAWWVQHADESISPGSSLASFAFPMTDVNPTADDFTFERLSGAVAGTVSAQDGVPSTPKKLALFPKRNYEGHDNSEDAFSAGVKYQIYINGSDNRYYSTTFLTNNRDYDYDVAQGIVSSGNDLIELYPNQPIVKSINMHRFENRNGTLTGISVNKISDTVFEIIYQNDDCDTPTVQGWGIGDAFKFRALVPNNLTNLRQARISSMVDASNKTTITIMTDSSFVDGDAIANTMSTASNGSYSGTYIEAAAAVLESYDEFDPQYSSVQSGGWVTESVQIRRFVNDPKSILEPEEATDQMVVQTKDYDFGSIATVKKLYDVKLSLKADDLSSLRVSVIIDQQFENRVEIYPTGAVFSSIKDWNTVTYRHTSPLSGHTFSVLIESKKTIYGFQLNDIVLIYRTKREISTEDG